MDYKLARAMKDYLADVHQLAVKEEAVIVGVVMSTPTGMLAVGGPGAPRGVTASRLTDGAKTVMNGLAEGLGRTGATAYHYRATDLILPPGAVVN